MPVAADKCCVYYESTILETGRIPVRAPVLSSAWRRGVQSWIDDDYSNMNRLKLSVLVLGCSLATAWSQTNSLSLPPIAAGPFKPDWNSLTNYQTPEWYRDAKFGIWAHWGPQCQPEHGDWYARGMYQEGSWQYQSHLAEYGHPSTNGFKEVIHAWKAEHFDPDRLLKFYKDNGAKIFMALANHHDNFDNFNSKYQPWNSVNVGPQKDLIGGWAKAARKNGLRFGVSVHASHAWTWYEPAQGADKTGPLAGVPYDGKLTKADGKGQWWDGLDPQDLYAQNHAPGNQKAGAGGMEPRHRAQRPERRLHGEILQAHPAAMGRLSSRPGLLR